MAETWFLAICEDCTPVLPQPFSIEADRDAWAVAHRDATGHQVTWAAEHRYQPPARLDGWADLGEADGGGRVYIAPLGTALPDSGVTAG